METIKLNEDGTLPIPEKHQITKEKKRLHIKMPWKTEIQTLCKDDFRINSVSYFRHKAMGQKPYVAVGRVEIDGVRYKVINNKASKSKEGRG